MQYSTDGNRRILPTYFVPDPSILKFRVVARVDEIVAYMYVWSVWWVRTCMFGQYGAAVWVRVNEGRGLWNIVGTYFML